MSSFVLVHGAWHGGWVWEKVVPLLEEAGHEVEAPDLPGVGEDKTPVPEVSLRGYVERVLRILDSRDEPVILVGHSMGGIVISEVAERRPDKVETLVYLSAFLLPNGSAMAQTAQQDTESVVTQNSRPHEGRGVVTLPPSVVRDAFYGDCSDEDASWAAARLREQGLAPLVTPVRVTEGNFGRVPRVYVTCLHDRTITPAIQEKMYTEMPCKEVVSLQADHSPFLSAREELARYLVSLAAA